jgi:hypothetical protein
MSRYSGPGVWTRDLYTGNLLSPRQQVKALKRAEADERNARTPAHRRSARGAMRRRTTPNGA